MGYAAGGPANGLLWSSTTQASYWRTLPDRQPSAAFSFENSNLNSSDGVDRPNGDDDSRLVLLIGLISHKTQQFDSTVT